MDFPAPIPEYIAAIEVRLGELLQRAVPGEIAPDQLLEAMRYSAMGSGKRLRPVMSMACAAALGAPAEVAMDAGCAVEMVHCFSLIHDDLPALDNDDLRRGKPTCHRAYGEAMAVLAGDALFAEALLLAAQFGGAVAQELASASSLLVRGEALDILSEGQPGSPELLDSIHRQKTSSLFGAACAIGGLVAKGSDEQVGHLREFGIKVGLAFQIADDLLNETSSAEVLGKAAGSDRDRGKLTYPALFGLERAQELATQAHASALRELEFLPSRSETLCFLANFAIERLH